MCEITVNRDELRRRLRDKIKSRRNNQNEGPQLAQRLKDDPKGAMLGMGLDDPQILAQAESIVKNPGQFLKSVLPQNKKHTKTVEKVVLPNNREDSEDEEAPPPL